LKTPQTFYGLAAEVLAANKKGDGTHRVLKLAYAGSPLVLKCYGRTRSRLESFMKLFGVRLIVGKTSTSARGRYGTEHSVLELWSREKFNVPKVLTADFTAGIPQPCLAMEWIPGLTLAEVVRSPEISRDRKKSLIARCALDMYQRHNRAVAAREPRLIFEHPSLHHVIVTEERLTYIDFEIAYSRKNDIERLARRETAGFLYSMAKASWELFPELFRAFIDAYADRSRLCSMIEELKRYGTVPVAGWLELFPPVFRFSKRHRRISSAAGKLTIPRCAG